MSRAHTAFKPSKSSATTKTQKALKRNWRDNSDHLIPGLIHWPSSESLSPGPAVIEAFAAGSLKARRIIESWQSDWSDVIVTGEVPA